MAEYMLETERKSLKTLIGAREEIAYNRLKNNPRYIEICQRQDKSYEIVEVFYQRFEKEERIAIHRHYEGETKKNGMEINEVYIQGMRDCSRLLSFLGAFNGLESEL